MTGPYQQEEEKGKMMKSSVFAVAFFWLCSTIGFAQQDVKTSLLATDTGEIWFKTSGGLVRNDKPGGPNFITSDPVSISGDLKFPVGTGPFPAVVLAHGCSGITDAEKGWEEVLRGWGYATFVVDSFGGRGLKDVCENVKPLGPFQRMPDVYGALQILITHPQIDPKRVALMGFSHGGFATLGASTTWAKKTFMPADKPGFAAFFPFYPPCNSLYPEIQQLSAPVRIHAAELDDLAPAERCVQLANSAKASGQDLSTTVYKGAYHSFDSPNLPRLFKPNMLSARECTWRLEHILGPSTPQSDNPSECLRKGGTIASNPEATEQARKNVRAQLAELLK
jgi:dienelactone hydrolase